MKLIILISMMVFSLNAFTATLNITIEGRKVIFENAMSIGGYEYAPTDWSISHSLAPTEKFIPGAYMTGKDNFITVTDGSGTSIDVPIELNGVQYNIASNQYTKKQNSLFGPMCNDSIISGNVISLKDNASPNCVADFSLDYGKEITPFYFYRPTFGIDPGLMTELFQGKPGGLYSGSVSADIRYYYLSNGGALTYRVVPEVFTANIKYTPNTLDSIEVSGDGILSPVYDTVNNTVSSETIFSITALGSFNTGLAITLLSNEFNLFHGESNIPFSVECHDSRCQDDVWIDNGINQLENSNTSLVIDSPAQIINFDLNVNYKDISVSDIESGNYSGSITVMFEELY